LQDSSKKLIELSQPASANRTEPTKHVASESTIDNSNAVETEPKTQEVYDKPVIKHEDDDVEDTHKEKEDDMVSSIMQLSGASLMYLSTIHLLNAQEMFAWLQAVAQ